MLTTLTAKITYNGNDATTSFDYPFKIWSATELEIWITDAAGAETQVVSNYTLSGVGSETGGAVVYPTAGDPLPTGHQITLRRILPLSQNFYDAVNNQAFQAEVLESAIDKSIAQVQQLKEDVDRSLRGSLASAIDPELPTPQAGKVLAWNSAEDGLVNLAASGTVAAGSIGTTELGDDAVTQAKMADNSVGTLELLDANVTTAKILDANVTTAKILDANITTAKILDDNVTGAKLAPAVAGNSLTQDGSGNLDVDAASDAGAGAIEIATQAEMEAASSAVLAVTPGRTKYHPGVAKVWAQIVTTAGVPAVTTSHNVTSVTDNGVGNYTINFTEALSGADYCAVATVEMRTDASLPTASIGAKAVGSVQVVLDGVNAGNNRFRLDDDCYVIVFGDV